MSTGTASNLPSPRSSLELLLDSNDVGSFARTCSGDNGTKPAPQKPLLQCCGVKDVSHSSESKCGKMSVFTFAPLVSSLCRLRMTFHAFLSGANTPTSRGCRRCVVLGGRQRRRMLLSRTFRIRYENGDHQEIIVQLVLSLS